MPAPAQADYQQTVQSSAPSEAANGSLTGACLILLLLFAADARATVPIPSLPWEDLPGSTFFSDARGISADGSTVVGYSVSATGTEAFRWTSVSGMVGLGILSGGNGGYGSFGQAASSDGSVVVGGSNTGSFPQITSQAFRWTAVDGMVGLGNLPAGRVGQANSVSSDGSVVVGWSDGSEGQRAFRWTASTGMVGLGKLPGGPFGSWPMARPPTDR